MENRFERTEMLLGAEAVARLTRCHVAVIGLGGVGSYAAEAIARAGVGEMTILDCDAVSETNINRQLCALSSTVGEKKTQVVGARIRDINPSVKLHILDFFYSSESREELFAVESHYDFIIDAIDTVSAKTDLIASAKERGVPIVSALGTGNKLRPELLAFSDIYATSICPLARAMRRELRKKGITSHRVLYSTEEPRGATTSANGRNYPGSVSWVPGCAGLMLAGYVVQALIAPPADK